MIPTLNGAGFVRLLDHMGSDAGICDVARVSFRAGHASGSDLPRSPARDRDLIRYLMRHRHSGPFEFATVHLHVRLPIYVARQWMRHRTMTFNEISGRYRELGDEVYLPDTLHTAPDTAKQGRGGEHPHSRRILATLRGAVSAAVRVYREAVAGGVAKEQARAVLPLGTMTEFVMRADLHNLLHFLSLRLDPHAQAEMREYAAAVLALIEPLYPFTVEAWRDYRQGAPALSRAQWAAIRAALPAAPPVPGQSAGDEREWAALWVAPPATPVYNPDAGAAPSSGGALPPPSERR